MNKQATSNNRNKTQGTIKRNTRATINTKAQTQRKQSKGTHTQHATQKDPAHMNKQT
jgi:hypothetical protein